MNDSADYFESLELHPGDPVSAETAGALPVADPAEPLTDKAEPLAEAAEPLTDKAEPSADPLADAPEATQAEIAANLGAILHSDSLDHVVAEVGAACVTRSDVASAVHSAVTDAVQAAVNGVVAVAVAAAVKANSSMNAEEVEKRFRQKYLGLGTPEPVAETPFLKPPRLQVEEDGSVALSDDAGLAVPDPADGEVETAPLDAAPEKNDAVDEALLDLMLEQHGMAGEPAEAAAGLEDPAPEACPEEAGEPEAVLAAVPEAVEPEAALAAPAVEPEAVTEAMPEPIEPEVEPASDSAVIEPAGIEPEAMPPVVPQAPPATPKPPVVPEAVVAPEMPSAVPSAMTPEVPLAEAETELAPMPAPSRPAMPQRALEPESVERTLRDEKTIQFVGFQVGTQMYAVPSILIREVIRRQPVSRLPVQSRYAPGVINLRGLVIPLVSLRTLLQADMPQEGARNQFCIITGTEGMRIALEVDKIRSMYVIPQADIVWNVGSVLGLDDDTVIGLFELEERLVPILSVERVAAILLEEGIDLESLSA